MQVETTARCHYIHIRAASDNTRVSEWQDFFTYMGLVDINKDVEQ